jgi:ankyrin repeat protein
MLYFFVIILSSIGYAAGGPLHEAAKKGDLDQINRLIEEGVTVDVIDENNNTPLYIAVDQGHKDVAELLILKGANVNAIDNKGRTPLDWATYSRHKDLMELLIRHGGETRTPWSGSPFGKWL